MGIIATYSFINGLLFWPVAFFVILFSDQIFRRRAFFLLIWIILSFAVIYTYYNYPSRDPLYQHGIGWKFDPVFIFRYLANPVIGHAFIFYQKIAMLAMGAALLGISVITVLVIFYYRIKIKVLSFWISLALFSISSAIMTSIGRDISFATYSRYITISYPFWLATIVILSIFACYIKSNSLIIKAIKVSVIICILLITIIIAFRTSFYSARFWSDMSPILQQSRDRLANSDFRDVSNLIETKGYWHVVQLHRLKKRQLSIYRER
jgi:hypothetical protein